ncbi:MAG: energy-coupling factor transporter transmembrane protein EcfT [Selenomonadaceae bacterium]|nr:energy-coupling factor transporter transmembrane protein EcfT [Selenomonadaceae bacterium]
MNITLGQYIDGDSFLHNMDSRVKFILIVILIIALFLFNIYLSLFAYTILTIILIYISKIPLNSVIKSIKPLYWILLLTLLTNPFFHEGKIIFSYSIISVTEEGILIGITMTVRLLLLIILSSLLTFTTKTIVLADAIEDLLKPLKYFKINPHTIAMIVSLGLRFVPTTIKEFEQIVKAQKSRGMDFDDGNLIKKIKNFIPIIFPLILLTFKRAEELSLAMEARCYTENKIRTRRKKLKMTVIDYKAVLFVFLFILTLIILQSCI